MTLTDKTGIDRFAFQDFNQYIFNFFFQLHVNSTVIHFIWIPYCTGFRSIVNYSVCHCRFGKPRLQIKNRKDKEGKEAEGENDQVYEGDQNGLQQGFKPGLPVDPFQAPEKV